VLETLEHSPEENARMILEHLRGMGILRSDPAVGD